MEVWLWEGEYFYKAALTPKSPEGDFVYGPAKFPLGQGY